MPLSLPALPKENLVFAPLEFAGGSIFFYQQVFNQRLRDREGPIINFARDSRGERRKETGGRRKEGGERREKQKRDRSEKVNQVV